MNITKIAFRRTHIEVVWNHGGQIRTSLFYRHSDYSWHPDPDTAKLPPAVLEALQQRMFRALTARPAEQRRRKRPASVI